MKGLVGLLVDECGACAGTCHAASVNDRRADDREFLANVDQMYLAIIDSNPKPNVFDHCVERGIVRSVMLCEDAMTSVSYGHRVVTGIGSAVELGEEGQNTVACEFVEYSVVHEN